jgi:succinate dehydrogenase / fumarate reductase membrane anchor subunit
MRRRLTGSAHSGLGEWLLQRVSALYMGVFVFYVALRLLVAPIADYAAWRGWFFAGAVRLGFALFFASLLIHSWVGMRSVFMDYLKPIWLRFLAQLLTATGLLLLAFWLARILLSGEQA